MPGRPSNKPHGTFVKQVPEESSDTMSQAPFYNTKSLHRISSMRQSEKRSTITTNGRKPMEDFKRLRTGESHAAEPQRYFLKDTALIFGGLNIDRLCCFKKYFPYNNCNYVVDYLNEVTYKRSEHNSFF